MITVTNVTDHDTSIELKPKKLSFDLIPTPVIDIQLGDVIHLFNY